MEKDDVDRWLRAYVEAWKSLDRQQVSALFTEDVRYRYHPWDDPVEGREAVVATWLGESDVAEASTPDEPGTYEAAYRTVAVDGATAVATGTTTYYSRPGGPVKTQFDNCYVMRFEPGGRCAEFTEWYMERPRPAFVMESGLP
jgi:ketosteroid isomerase-like protein